MAVPIFGAAFILYWEVKNMSSQELESKCRELRQLQALIDEAQAEADAIRDAIKAAMGASESMNAGEYKISHGRA